MCVHKRDSKRLLARRSAFDEFLCCPGISNHVWLHSPGFQAAFESNAAGRVVIDDEDAEILQVAPLNAGPCGEREIFGLDDPEPAGGVKRRSSRQVAFKPDPAADQLDEF
jgi:hypothetical protein